MDLQETWDPNFYPGYEEEVMGSSRSNKWSSEAPWTQAYSTVSVGANVPLHPHPPPHHPTQPTNSLR